MATQTNHDLALAALADPYDVETLMAKDLDLLLQLKESVEFAIDSQAKEYAAKLAKIKPKRTRGANKPKAAATMAEIAARGALYAHTHPAPAADED